MLVSCPINTPMGWGGQEVSRVTSDGRVLLMRPAALRWWNVCLQDWWLECNLLPEWYQRAGIPKLVLLRGDGRGGGPRQGAAHIRREETSCRFGTTPQEAPERMEQEPRGPHRPGGLLSDWTTQWTVKASHQGKVLLELWVLWAHWNYMHLLLWFNIDWLGITYNHIGIVFWWQ